MNDPRTTNNEQRTTTLQPVILCGGPGTRLWPLARAGFPKQFLVLAGNESLFQQAVQRLAGLAADDLALAAPLIVGNEPRPTNNEQRTTNNELEPAALLLEPIGRNTAPALTFAAQAALETGTDPVLVPRHVNFEAYAVYPLAALDWRDRLL